MGDAARAEQTSPTLGLHIRAASVAHVLSSSRSFCYDPRFLNTLECLQALDCWAGLGSRDGCQAACSGLGLPPILQAGVAYHLARSGDAERPTRLSVGGDRGPVPSQPTRDTDTAGPSVWPSGVGCRAAVPAVAAGRPLRDAAGGVESVPGPSLVRTRTGVSGGPLSHGQNSST
jgi:hypothetical protein